MMRNRIIYIAGIITVILLNILSWISTSFSDWYVLHIFPIWLGTYARFTSLFPISIGEIMLALGVVITLILVILFIINLIAKKRYARQLKRYALFYAWTFLTVCFVMTFNCFIIYHSTSFADKYLMDDTDMTYTKSDLAILRDYIVDKCNTLAKETLHDDNGALYYEGDIIEAARNAMIEMGEEYDQLSGFYVTPKYLTFSGFFSQQNIMGYYFPFSLEANINSVMYISNVPTTVCHELAHTKGFIYEEDANMIGFLACINSEDVFLQYCGYLSVLNYVNNDFYDSIDKDRTIYNKHVGISELVSGDNIFLTKESWQKVEEKAIVNTETVKKVSNSLMDTSLKLNGVEEGVLAYNGVVGLLLGYYNGILY